MLGNCEKKKMMTATNQWPQPQILDDQKNFMASAVSKNKVMEKTNQDHQQVQHLPLKCPRCDSSNTKFCYYNNYSLSQPRHFCKACKRYWTRGGTLRNVPVGGGCRKNKRLKRPPPPPPPPSSNGADGISSAPSTATTSPSTIQPHIDLSSTSNHINNPMFYSVPTNNYHLGINNFPFCSRFNSNRVSSDSNEFDFQMSGVGLGFVQNYDHEYKNGFNPVKRIQDSSISTSTSSLVSGAAANDSILFGSSNFASTSTMASFLASSLQRQKLITNGLKDVTASDSFPGLMPVEDMQMPDGNGGIEKEVKNIGQNRLDWNPYPVEQINSSDSSSLLWNSANVGSWFDPSNMGSSVPSLI